MSFYGRVIKIQNKNKLNTVWIQCNFKDFAIVKSWAQSGQHENYDIISACYLLSILYPISTFISLTIAENLNAKLNQNVDGRTSQKHKTTPVVQQSNIWIMAWLGLLAFKHTLNKKNAILNWIFSINIIIRFVNFNSYSWHSLYINSRCDFWKWRWWSRKALQACKTKGMEFKPGSRHLGISVSYALCITFPSFFVWIPPSTP